MIRKILIANRGEIACRIIRTCRHMGIATVAVYSDADTRALHVEIADEAVRVGAAPAAESYLNILAIIEAAQRTGADAVHPGYGFLAENAQFAQAVIDAGLIFIGPPPSVIEAMGSKREAKRIAIEAGVPVVPGYNDTDQSDERLITAADEIGYPIMVKASAGGGGKGMRLVASAADLPDALAAARREAKSAFGDDTLLLEKAIQHPRHVEIQIFGDTHGNVMALGERECSIQRRHQKIIEETPSTALDDDLRARMCAAAVSVGKAIGYVNAGTVEFMLDADKNFYFLEVNTRLQVEHSVTEVVSKEDLVAWQIKVAQGDTLPTAHTFDGHAIEVRVYAEDPANEFLPVTGEILRWQESAGARFDSGVRSGDTVSVYYDPMLAKVIAHGDTREDAIRRLDYALAQMQLLGLRNNIAFLRRILNHPEFIAGNVDTGFIDRHPELLTEMDDVPLIALVAAAAAKEGLPQDMPLASAPVIDKPRSLAGAYLKHWRNNAYRPIRHQFKTGANTYTVNLTPIGQNRYRVQVGEQEYDLQLEMLGTGDYVLTLDGHRQRVTVVSDDDDLWWVHTPAGAFSLSWISPLPAGRRAAEAEGSLRSPMPGKVIAVNVTDGQIVSKGDILLVIEAMKMEHRIKAPYNGRVASVYYRVGQSVEAGAALLELHPIEKP
jgi:acetyl-CoA carboxylase biotin carboxylase subunit